MSWVVYGSSTPEAATAGTQLAWYLRRDDTDIRLRRPDSFKGLGVKSLSFRVSARALANWWPRDLGHMQQHHKAHMSVKRLLTEADYTYRLIAHPVRRLP